MTGTANSASQRTLEHRKAATRAGLTYVSDGVAGITRRRAGSGWVYFAPNGVRIRDPLQRKRLNSLAIPPAWTDVWICPDENGHIQAPRAMRAQDAYRYIVVSRGRDRSKFATCSSSARSCRVRARVERDALRRPYAQPVLATVIRRLDARIRVGNDEYAGEPSFGFDAAPAARERERRLDALTFPGKAASSTMSRSPMQARAHIRAARDLPGGQELSNTWMRAASARRSRGCVTRTCARSPAAKDCQDLRTWGGTMHAAMALAGDGSAASRGEAIRTILAWKGLREPGNSGCVCRKSMCILPC